MSWNYRLARVYYPDSVSGPWLQYRVIEYYTLEDGDMWTEKESLTAESPKGMKWMLETLLKDFEKSKGHPITLVALPDGSLEKRELTSEEEQKAQEYLKIWDNGYE